MSLLWPPEDAGLMAVQAQQIGLRWWQFLECRASWLKLMQAGKTMLGATKRTASLSR